MQNIRSKLDVGNTDNQLTDLVTCLDSNSNDKLRQLLTYIFYDLNQLEDPVSPNIQ